MYNVNRYWRFFMEIQMFNFWYFFWVVLSVGSVVGLYFALRNKSDKTKKIVLFIILIIGLIAHSTQFLYPPYSTDTSRMLRDSWFGNICGANILLFPFFLLSKNDRAKDYMFYLGLLGGLGAVLYPLEPMQKVDQASEWIDIIRFYFHHTLLWGVPLVMVLTKLHTLSYKRVLWCPVYFLGVCLFIILNQWFQSELGFTDLRSSDFFNINFKNSSMIYKPSGFLEFLGYLVPSFFKTVPVGPHAGEFKYWPWFWMIVPTFLLLTPIAFLLCMIFDHKNFGQDCKNLFNKIKLKFQKK